MLELLATREEAGAVGKNMSGGAKRTRAERAASKNGLAKVSSRRGVCGTSSPNAKPKELSVVQAPDPFNPERVGGGLNVNIRNSFSVAATEGNTA